MDNKGHFKIGHVPWNKGIGKGKKPYVPTGRPVGRPKGIPSWNKGKKVPQITGKNHPLFGKHYFWTEEQKIKLRGLKSKEKHPLWIADRNQLIKSEKKHLDGRYREWMFSVKNRDGWKWKIQRIDVFCQKSRWLEMQN